ncbi:MAG: hypothetical protein ACK5AZ_04030 [Bryobacteraceae bacterium]
MDPEIKPAATVEPPRGFYPARVDDKGRLKLPVRFQEYLGSLPEKRLFVTSLDGSIARIYPNSVWKENEEIFRNNRTNPRAAQRIAFLANALGADAEMDGQGRVLLPPELRRKLGIENQSVQLLFYRGRVDIYSQELYERELRLAEESQAEDLLALEESGLI